MATTPWRALPKRYDSKNQKKRYDFDPWLKPKKMGQATNLHHQNNVNKKQDDHRGLTYTREKGKIDMTCWQNKGHQRTYDEGTAIGQFMSGSPQTLDPLHRPSATLGHEISPDRVSPEPCICPLSRIRGNSPNRWPIYQIFLAISWETTSVSSLCQVHNYIWPPLKHMFQWIGLRENLQESPIFNGKNLWFPVDFSLKPIHWHVECPTWPRNAEGRACGSDVRIVRALKWAWRSHRMGLGWTKIQQDSPCLAYEIYEFIKQT